MRKLILPGLLLILLTSNLIAQKNFKPGYIITPVGDTVYGYIDYRSDNLNFSRCVFKETEQGEETKYLPGEVRSYYFIGGKFYTTKTIGDSTYQENVFMEYLVNGISDIFYHNGNFYIEKDDNFVKLTNEDIEIINEEGEKRITKSNRYKGILKYLYGDCEEIQDDIEKSKLAHKSLIQISSKYHNLMCTTGEDCVIYEKKVKFLSLDVAPIYGILKPEYSIKRYIWSDHMDLDEDYQILYGLFLDLDPNFLNDNFRVIISSNIFETGLKGEFTDKFPTSEYIYEADYSAKYLKVGLGIKYIYPTKGRIKPYLSMSGDLNTVLNSNNWLRITHRSLLNDYESVSYSNYTMFKDFYGITTNIGLEYLINKNHKLFLNFGYSYGAYEEKKEYEDETMKFTINSFYTNLGYYFNLF